MYVCERTESCAFAVPELVNAHHQTINFKFNLISFIFKNIK